MEIPFLVVQGILYTMIVYWCTGQSANAGKSKQGGCQAHAALPVAWPVVMFARGVRL